MTFDLHQKTIGFLYSMWYTYIPNMRSVQASLVEISCLQGFLQGFHNLTPVDPKWPLTSTKNNRLLVLNVVHLHTKYENCPSFPSWDIVFTRFLQGFHNLTPVDPKWPLTSTKNNRLLVLNVVHLHTKYENCPSFPSWDIVFTSRRTHIHTHTRAAWIQRLRLSSKPTTWGNINICFHNYKCSVVCTISQYAF